MNARRVTAVSRRHAYVLMRSPHRWFDVFIWPVVDVLLWGSLGVFIADQGAVAAQAGVTYLLAGMRALVSRAGNGRRSARPSSP